MNELKKHYIEKIIPKLKDEFKYSNINEVPKITSVAINMGMGDAVNNKGVIDNGMEAIRAITGQQPLTTYTRKSIAGFKIRDGWPIGVKVTLRRDNMYDFLNKLITIVLPRIRDFRGLNPRSFDGMGNYNFGVKEHIIFPEIDYNKIDKMLGMNITITTTAKTDEEALSLLKLFGFPLTR